MQGLCAGDLVRRKNGGPAMVIVGCADDRQPPGVPGKTFFCVWEDRHHLHEEVFDLASLVLLRPDRRRVPRRECPPFPRSGRRG
jgi:uncharacterized protein YodC (DUF2158 family)